MKVYVLMRHDFGYENDEFIDIHEKDEMIDIYRDRETAENAAENAADEFVERHPYSDTFKVVKKFDYSKTKYGYIVQYLDLQEDELEHENVEFWVDEKMYYVVEKEVKN